ncbi:MAG TPA: YihY/virulence factor BrkB family protein [Pseudonocardiaceae bacterium]|nr:YihY/virulence factor BrkB family protein [Pseudonocardiaceae bacterium]
MRSTDEDSADAGVRGTLDRLDSYQQRHPALGVPIAVVRKFLDDQSINLAAVIAFWAFFSIFPLLLVFVTLIGYFLPPSLREDVLSSAASYFPMISTDSIVHLSGRWWTLVVGIFSGLWAGSFVVIATQSAFNSVWEIPYVQRRGFGKQIGRSLFALSAIGLGLIASTMISSYVTGIATGPNLGVVGHIAGYLIPVVLDVGLFIVAFRLLTDHEVATRDVLPGALLSGIVFWLLQQLSSLVIFRYLHNAERIYGSFATVITMLWWLYLQSVVTLLGAQLNVVLKERLYPRGLVNGPTTEPDYRAYEAYAKERTYHHGQQVHTEFLPHSPDDKENSEV